MQKKGLFMVTSINSSMRAIAIHKREWLCINSQSKVRCKKYTKQNLDY